MREFVIVLVMLGLMGLLLKLAGPHTKSAQAPAAAAASAPVAPEIAAYIAKEKRECAETVAAKRAKYSQLMKSRSYWEAFLELSNCAERLQDKELRALADEAERLSYIATANNRRADPADRIRAIDAMEKYFPAEAEKLVAMRPALIEQEERQRAQRRAAEAKKRGVVIGMTPDEVLASSWGRPDSVNRTTTVHGTREQWVYGGYNFLYFEGGKLVAIQN